MSVQDNGVINLTNEEWAILRQKAPAAYKALFESNKLLLSPDCGHTIEWGDPGEEWLISCQLHAGHKGYHEGNGVEWDRKWRSKKPWNRESF